MLKLIIYMKQWLDVLLDHIVDQIPLAFYIF